MVVSVLSSAVNRQRRKIDFLLLTLMHAHLPYQIVCAHLHVVPCIGYRTRMLWVKSATRTTLL